MDFNSAIVANSAPTSTLKVTGNTGVGDTLTALLISQMLIKR